MSSAPIPPDPYATAAAQTQSNKDTAGYNAALNRVSQYTPYGNLVYSTTGTDAATGAPQYRADVSLAPEAQQQLDNILKQNNQISNLGFTLGDQAANTIGKQITTDSIPALRASVQTGPLNYGADIQPGEFASKVDKSGIPGLPGMNDFNSWMGQAIDAQYNRNVRYLDPQFRNMQNDLDAQLANQGINVSSNPAAWNRAEQQLGLQRMNAYGQAADQAISEGNTLQNNWTNQRLQANQIASQNALAQAQYEANAQNQKFQQALALAGLQNSTQQQAFGQALTNANLNNSTAAQSLQQQTALQTLPINELNAVRSATQIQNPTFGNVPTATAQGTDVAGPINQNYQNQLASYNNSASGLFGLGSSVLSAIFSDRRLKTDIKRIGKTDGGLPIYTFRYKGAPAIHMGVMAQDVEKVNPAAVATVNGYKAVNYGAIA